MKLGNHPNIIKLLNHFENAEYIFEFFLIKRFIENKIKNIIFMNQKKNQKKFIKNN